ncbi:MAG: MMPL family transporter, partial [Chloroflexota bacterium]|nr:MMPL family transporter [Chloroflexota bacterium]
MFATWGRILAAHRRLVAALSVLSLVAFVFVLATVSPELSADGFISEEAESARVDLTLEEEFGRGSDSLVFLFDAPRRVADPAVRQAVEASLAPLVGDARFSTVLTTWSTGNPRFVSDDGTATYAVALIDPDAAFETADFESVTETVHDGAAANGLTVETGGGEAIGFAISEEVAEGIARAEIVSVPLTILVQVLVFGSLVAAGVPLLIGAIAILASIALIFVLSQDVFQSVFAVNIITMLGLGLGIDYSLFMVTRFREEIAHRSVEDALAVTMATVGKAILFSGITVIFGLAATQFFPLPSLQSMGQAGMLVTALALVYGLTLLPAMLAMLGGRINRFSISRNRGTSGGTEGRFWHGLANTVMTYPVAIMVTVVVLLLGAGLPLLRLDLTPGGPDVLPADQGPRIVSERLASDFSSDDTEPIPVLVTAADGNPASEASVAALRGFTDELSVLPGVTSVNSFVSPEISGAAGFDWGTYGGDPATLPPTLATTMQTMTRNDQAFVQVSTSESGTRLEQQVRDIRAMSTPGLDIEVGGFAAGAVDTLDGINSGLVPAAIFVLVGAYLILLLTFGSVFLPLKAIFMTLLSISAALGAVVFVFQDGNFEGLFRFE